MNFFCFLVESVVSTETKHPDLVIKSVTSTGKISLKTILHYSYHAL